MDSSGIPASEGVSSLGSSSGRWPHESAEDNAFSWSKAERAFQGLQSWQQDQPSHFCLANIWSREERDN